MATVKALLLLQILDWRYAKDGMPIRSSEISLRGEVSAVTGEVSAVTGEVSAMTGEVSAVTGAEMRISPPPRRFAEWVFKPPR